MQGGCLRHCRGQGRITVLTPQRAGILNRIHARGRGTTHHVLRAITHTRPRILSGDRKHSRNPLLCSRHGRTCLPCPPRLPLP